MKKLLTIILIFTAFTIKAQTFVVTEINNYSGISQQGIEKNNNLKGKEVTLTLTDNDVRISAKDQDGIVKTQLLEKKGYNIYRKNTSDNGSSYNEIELDIFLGYIRGFTYTHYHKGSFGGGFKAKRK